MAMVVLVTSFLGLGWWQVSRAAAGNAISWGYAVEWPVFAGFVVFVWWREVKHALRGAPTTGESQAPAPGTGPVATEQATAGADRPRPAVRRPVRVTRVAVDDGGEDADLAAYNRYLSWLNANPGAKPEDYPG
ncbi:hypothetical protein GCM10011608_36040 [Micromonospora sonchi]|uniref:DNA-binding transcriptional regulator of glucitol operon n=1 Tax=Micromonospora sonchi TaxID=1763543 RepID=A0A917U089_9ACTN|nr:hypothetical protein GCM10011608_36040 [Micromonospora sonchi]